MDPEKQERIKELREKLSHAQQDKQFETIKSLQIELNQLLFPTDDDSDDDDTGEELGCTNNDLLDPLAPAWTTSHVPDITILFRDPRRPNAKPNRQCYRRESLTKYVRKKKTDMRMWVPNSVRQLKLKPVDNTGHGGMPSMVETYVRLPDSTLILIDPSFLKKMKPGQYEGIPLYEVRYGNRVGSFGPSQIHGQTPSWVYLVVSSNTSKAVKQLQRCLERHLRVRDPYGLHHYQQLRPAVVTRDFLITAIRMMHQRFPIPVMDIFRPYDDSDEHLNYWKRFNFKLHEMVSPTDALSQIAEKLYHGDPVPPLNYCYGSDEDAFCAPFDLKSFKKEGHLTAEDNELFFNIYRSSKKVRQQNDDDYPPPLLTTDVARGILSRNDSFVLFRWNGLYWQPVFFSLFQKIDWTDLHIYVPDITKEEEELLKKGQTSPRFRLVTKNSTPEELDLLVFSMRPRLASMAVMKEYLLFDPAIKQYLSKLSAGNLYYSSRFWRTRLDSVGGKSMAELEAELSGSGQYYSWVVSSNKDTNNIFTSRGKGFNAVRHVFFTDPKFQSRVLEDFVLHNYSKVDFDSIFAHLESVPCFLIVKRLTKRQRNQSGYTFIRAVDGEDWDEDNLQEDELVVTDDKDIAWQLFQTESTFRQTVMKLVMRALLVPKLNELEKWSQYSRYVSYTVIHYTRLHNLIQDKLKFAACGSYQSEYMKEQVAMLLQDVKDKIADMSNEQSIPTLYF